MRGAFRYFWPLGTVLLRNGRRGAQPRSGCGGEVALWVSAFEILAHDGEWSSPGLVLSKLNGVHWLSRELKAQNHVVFFDKKEKNPILTNVAGVIYKHLYNVRNAFLHGTLRHGERALQIR